MDPPFKFVNHFFGCVLFCKAPAYDVIAPLLFLRSGNHLIDYNRLSRLVYKALKIVLGYYYYNSCRHGLKPWLQRKVKTPLVVITQPA